VHSVDQTTNYTITIDAVATNMWSSQVSEPNQNLFTIFAVVIVFAAFVVVAFLAHGKLKRELTTE
jgi:predicted neutral ceramidase superfamily lipid hydrolase